MAIEQEMDRVALRPNRRWAAFGCVLAVFALWVGLGRLSPAEAVLSGGLIMAVIAYGFIPRALPPAVRAPALPATPLDDAIIGKFADALPDPTIVLSQRGAIRHINPAARAQFPSAAIGFPLAFSLRQPALLEAIEMANREGQSRNLELAQAVPTPVWYRVTIAPIAADDGGDGFTLLSFHDLSEQKRVDAMRSDFIAYASHELRTPLTSLMGFIDTLLGPAAKDAAAREKFLRIMRSQAERMSKLIDDLLSLSRIEMRQHERPTTQVELRALLREVVANLAPQAEAAEVSVALSLPEAPVTVLGDKDELFEVFENVIDNAIKYGAEGKAVEVELGASERPGFAHAISVTDHGPGIDPQHVPRLTERFYRVDADSSRKKKGTGLGLAIVKHIVNRHRGTLALRSAPGEGMRVVVHLPAAKI